MSKEESNISLNESKITIDLLNESDLIDDKDKANSEKKRSSRQKQRVPDEKQQEEKLKREIEKKKKDTEREEDKKRKEAEKELERKKKEEEKRIKQAEKEEEKRRKEEEKRLKDAEREEDKRKKEEEKRLKDAEREEDKRKKEEERKRREEEKRKEELIKKKQTATILNFFQKKIIKVEQDIVESCHELQRVGLFQPIELKKDMRLAAIERIKRPLIDSLNQLEDQGRTYFEDILNRVPCTNNDTWPISLLDCEVVDSCIPMRLSTKSFLFTENVRPPYFGTWRKTSSLITPLNPLSEDPSFFDYDVDSDQEWEYESGEDISNSEGEVEEEVNEEGDDSSFLVPHDYLSDGENCSDIEVDVKVADNRRRSISPKSRQAIIEIREKQFQAEVKQKVQTINPNLVGPYFLGDDNCQQTKQIMEPFRMICQSVDGTPINCNMQSDFDHSTNSSKSKPVPIEAVPHLIRLLHHNALSREKICYEFRMFWEYHLTSKLPDVTLHDDLEGKDWDEFTIGKKKLTNKIKEIAEWRDKKWIVKPEIIHEYQLCCIDDDPLKGFAEQWKYVTNILTVQISKKIPRKSKVIENEPKVPGVQKELKPSKKRKQSLDPMSSLKQRNSNAHNYNPSVRLIDNVNEKLEEMETDRMAM